jgi:hypothetical protein
MRCSTLVSVDPVISSPQLASSALRSIRLTAVFSRAERCFD